MPLVDGAGGDFFFSEGDAPGDGGFLAGGVGEDEVADLALEDGGGGRVGGGDGDVGDAEEDGAGVTLGVGVFDLVGVANLDDVDGAGDGVWHGPAVAVGDEGGDGGEADWRKGVAVTLPNGARTDVEGDGSVAVVVGDGLGGHLESVVEGCGRGKSEGGDVVGEDCVGGRGGGGGGDEESADGDDGGDVGFGEGSEVGGEELVEGVVGLVAGAGLEDDVDGAGGDVLGEDDVEPVVLGGGEGGGVPSRIWAGGVAPGDVFAGEELGAAGGEDEVAFGEEGDGGGGEVAKGEAKSSEAWAGGRVDVGALRCASDSDVPANDFVGGGGGIQCVDIGRSVTGGVFERRLHGLPLD